MSGKRSARMAMLQKMKEKMKGEMGKSYKEKMGDKISSVKVVAPEKKMPEALSIAEKLMSAKKDSCSKEYKDGGYKDGGSADKEDYKKKLMKSYKKKS